MSGQDGKKSDPPTGSDDLSLELEDDLDWDDALDQWQQELADEETAERPDAKAPAPPLPKQPLYRPQTSLAPQQSPAAPTPPAAAADGRPSASSLVDFDDDLFDGPMDETRVGDPAANLLATLEADTTTATPANTGTPAAASDGGDDLDIDALLDGLELDDAAPPAPAPMKAPPAAPPRPPTAPKRGAYQPPAPKPPKPRAPRAPIPRPPGLATPPRAPAKGPIGLRPRPIHPEASEEADEATPIVQVPATTSRGIGSPAAEAKPTPAKPAAAAHTFRDILDDDDDEDRTQVASVDLLAELTGDGAGGGGDVPSPSLDSLPEPELSIGADDDDEPELSIGAADDDEPEISIGDDDDDDDEPVISVGDDDDFPEIGSGDDFDDLDDFGDLDDWDDDELTAFAVRPSAEELAPATPSHAPPSDAGARAAARTVRHRKPRQEHFPMVGRGPEVNRARRSLLTAAAENTTGASRARLLVAAAELCEQLGEADIATEHYRDAHQADPTDVVALRALRRDAIQRGEWVAVAALLEEESKLPLSADDRAAALTLLAEVQLTRQGDAAAAQKSARSALGLRRNSVAAALLLAETGFAVGREAEAMTAVERAAEHWSDGAPKAALLCLAGVAAERAGRSDKALEAFAKATEADPESFDAMLGLARAQRAAGDLDANVIAVARAGEHAGEGVVAEAFRRASARIVHLMGKRPAHATALLFDAKGVLAHRARAAAARDSGDAEARAGAVAAWAAAAGGSERALALTILAELQAAKGDFENADAALRDAALADNTLGLIRIVREIVGRSAGADSRFARSGDELSESALVSAAKLAQNSGALERERELLARAKDETDAPAAAAVIALDLAAGVGDTAQIAAGLGHEVERASGEQKVGPLLTLALEARVHGDVTVTEALLEQAREARPGDPVILRSLARHIAVGSPIDAAQCWLAEAAAATGGRAAFTATCAGRLLASAGQDPDDALSRAFDAVPAYGPAAWALEPLVRGRGEAGPLAELNTAIADAAADPVDRAGRYVRAALLTAATDMDAAAALLEKARDAVPEDAILVELSLRLSQNASAAERAALLTAGAERAAPGNRRAMLLRAAATHLDAGEAAEAAAMYRRVLEESGGDDPLAMRALDQSEIAAGEVSRVASRRFDAVKSAADDEAQVQALQALADLDLHDRQDPGSAVLSLQSILELSPGHLPSLRALERYFMDQDRLEELARVEAALVEHLPVPGDVAPHGRLAARLALLAEDAGGDAADEVLLRALDRSDPDLWLSRRGGAAAVATGDQDLVRKATVAAAGHLTGALERATGALRAADALMAAEDRNSARLILAPAVDAAAGHLPAAQLLAELYQADGDDEGTARAFEVAGRAAMTPELRAKLFHEAGMVLEDQLGQKEQAAIVYAEAAQANVTHADLFERYRRLLEEAGDKEGLATLTERRVAAGGDVAVLAELQGHVADLREQLGDRSGAKDALRAALSFEGENADALKRLAELCLSDEDYRGAAESLIRLARVRKDREELRWVFFTLGTIYDSKMPDARRAEAAYRRVLKLIPTDVDSMERLANLYERENSLDKAVDMLKQLAENELDPDLNRDHRLRLATTLEKRGDLRGAESVLEQTRRNAPVDLVVLEGLASLYRRQNAPQALSMHLNRAVADFRQALETDPTDSAAWVGLTEVLRWRGRPDAARVAASAAATIGIQSDQLASMLSAHGGVPGAGAGASMEELDEQIGSQTIPRATRAIFQMAHEAFEKALPYDPKSIRAEKINQRGNAFQAAGKDVAHWFDLPEPQIQVTKSAPRVCVPVSANPFTVLIGQQIYDGASEFEKRFLLARAAKIVKSELVVAARSQPLELALAIAGLIRSYDPMYAPPGLDPGQLDTMTKKIGRAIGRKLRDPMQPLVLEMAGTHGFDPARLGLLACELGDRAALLATGSLPAAIAALLRLAGRDDLAQLPSRQRFAAMQRVAEAKDLFEFALSEVHFEARRSAGVDGA